MKQEIEICGVWLTVDCSIVDLSFGDQYEESKLKVSQVFFNDKDVTIFLEGQDNLDFENEQIWRGDKLCPIELHEIIQEYANPIEKIEQIINE